MGFLDPRPPGFDPEEWRRQPYHERLRWMCQSWVLQGFGAPPAVYVFYVLKIVLYVGVWVLFVTRSSATGGVAEIATWWAEPVAFQKAVLWSLAFEAMGLGAASGPLTGRYVPPFGGALYFVRPGTTRLPPFPRVPLTGGVRRTLVDVGLYVALLGLLLRALLAAEPTVGMLTPVAVLLPVIGLRDKTIFLAARSEHYWVTVLVFLFPGDLLAGSKTVQLALWWWAATSKLNHHFPNVVAVMVSNSPVLRLR